MSAANAITGLKERLRTIAGLTVVTGIPDTIQKSDLACLYFIGATNGTRGQVRRHVWRFGIRVVVSLQENTLAEDRIMTYADSIPGAIFGDMTLGGRANVMADIEQSAEGEDGYLAVSSADGTTVSRYRSIVFRLEVVDKEVG